MMLTRRVGIVLASLALALVMPAGAAADPLAAFKLSGQDLANLGAVENLDRKSRKAIQESWLILFVPEKHSGTIYDLVVDPNRALGPVVRQSIAGQMWRLDDIEASVQRLVQHVVDTICLYTLRPDLVSFSLEGGVVVISGAAEVTFDLNRICK